MLTIAIGLLLAACAGGGEGGTTTSSPSAPTTGEVTQTTAAAPDTTTSTGAAPSSTEGSSAGGDDCLVGMWTLDSEAFVENFDAIMTEAGMPDAEVTSLDGTFEVEMNADGSYVAVRDEWGFSMGTPQGTVVIEINGTETGTWSTSGSTLNIDPGENDLTVDSSIVVDGQEIPMPGSDLPVEAPPGLATASEFQCSGDTLTLESGGVESVLNRS
jgi:hypothetical protein